MKVSRLKYIAMGAILGLSFVSCEDFLDRPNEDSYNDGNYFQNYNRQIKKFPTEKQNVSLKHILT